MFITTQLRVLRRRHRITLLELATSSGMSNQHLSRLELAICSGTPGQEKKVGEGVETLIARRKSALENLEQDYLAHKGRLLERMEVLCDEQ